MMRLASILLGFHILLGTLLPNSDYAEIAKFPDLYEHYHLHQQRAHSTLSLVDFLMMHYADPQHQRSENHEKLPFQHHSCCANVFLYILSSFEFGFTPDYRPSKRVDFFQLRFCSSNLDSIFQPPRQ